MSWDPNTSHTPTSSASGSGAIEREKKPLVERSGSKSSSVPSPSLLIDHVLNPPAIPREDENSETSSPRSDQYPFLTKFLYNLNVVEPDLWVRDMELMHHWTVETFDGLSQQEDMRHTWRVEAPRQAVNHLFLMHEMLAFAAFHKAYQQPDRQHDYYTIGTHHQDRAIKGIRLRLANITRQEAAAVVATSTLLTLSIFASSGLEAKHHATDGTWSAIDNILNIFSVMQGMGSVLALARVHVLDSWLGPMFKSPLEPTPSQPMVQGIIDHIPTLTAFIESKPDLSDKERKEYLDVIGYLKSVLYLAMPPCLDYRELRFLFYWPLYLGPDFMTFLREKRSGALVLLMYYATMLFAAGTQHWFIDDWGHRLMTACHEEVERDWLPAVQWPMAFLNLTPTWNLISRETPHEQSPGLTAAQTHEQEASASPYSQQAPREISYRQSGYTPLTSHERELDPHAPWYIRSTANAKPTPAATLPQESQKSAVSGAGYVAPPAEDAG
ncbi:hypothetical protein P153DRAFT_388592 [Dothidotthia symphoricarpi CBS 119687]|uniref:Uncharacterized protein n=1 Tax=Dothidotthia symphoricarpi CBS 119687 TaxID=1392245 RepID=A0A6A6A5V1_9PLEO|nr:uncharacterized protein P153DRAFT_388592 [Dothidotthia symphoricarpi CBS 119687]KAF2126555.1 hypothetical protein P153DRAFT_388592 [Dothidotthia symphoricarpi CBS 119687]